jgi:tryptophanyl-tRNA synthetase
MGYGEVKKMLLAKVEAAFTEYRVRRKELLKDPEKVELVLNRGAEKARAAARKTLDDVKRAVGLGTASSRL